MTHLGTQPSDAPPPVAPTPEGRRWIAIAMEAQYGADAPETDFARTLWRRSLAARREDGTRPAIRAARTA
jgi:hypothetical protein